MNFEMEESTEAEGNIEIFTESLVQKQRRLSVFLYIRWSLISRRYSSSRVSLPPGKYSISSEAKTREKVMKTLPFSQAIAVSAQRWTKHPPKIATPSRERGNSGKWEGKIEFAYTWGITWRGRDWRWGKAGTCFSESDNNFLLEAFGASRELIPPDDDV